MAKLGECARALKFVSLIFALALGFASVNAKADDSYPNRPVRIIVSFSAGGPTDIVGRVFAQKLTELLGQQFFVENKVGAGGNIGADQVAKSPPDGYTLLVATVSTHAINPGLYSKMPYDPIKDFAPVAHVGITPTTLNVHPSLGVKDVKGLIALVKDNPGKYTYGSSGLGSILHLCGEQFKSLAGGLQIQHVPYRGSPQSLTGLLAGEVQAMFDTLSTSIEHIKAGRLRALGVSLGAADRSAARHPRAKRSRPRLRGDELAGLWGPERHAAGDRRETQPGDNTPLADATVKARIEATGYSTFTTASPAEFRAHIADETAKWGKVIRTAGIRLN